MAFTEISGATAPVRMDVVGGDGTTLATTTRRSPPTPILGRHHRALGLAPQSNFRVNFTVTSPTGRIVPFATYVDDVTGDSIFEPAVDRRALAGDLILTQAAHVIGANNDFFQTNLYLTNVDAQPVNVTVSLIPNVLTGAAASTKVYTMAPGQTLEKLDVLVTEFGLADPSIAGLRIHPDRAARLVVTNSTYVAKFGGTFGYSIPAVPASQAIGRRRCRPSARPVAAPTSIPLQLRVRGGGRRGRRRPGDGPQRRHRRGDRDPDWILAANTSSRRAPEDLLRACSRPTSTWNTWSSPAREGCSPTGPSTTTPRATRSTCPPNSLGASRRADSARPTSRFARWRVLPRRNPPAF